MYLPLLYLSMLCTFIFNDDIKDVYFGCIKIIITELHAIHTKCNFSVQYFTTF